MEASLRKWAIVCLVGVFVVLSGLSLALAEDYDAMMGVNNANAMFDMRNGTPKSAAVLMKLIYDTHTELTAMNKNPEFVVVFMSGAVKLISSHRDEFSEEDRNYLKEIDDVITKMTKAGIDVEVCMAAVNYFKVDPDSISSEIKRVGNGWISEIGYQARGYSLVPVY